MCMANIHRASSTMGFPPTAPFSGHTLDMILDGVSPYSVPRGFAITLHAAKFSNRLMKTVAAAIEEASGISHHVLNELEDEFLTLKVSLHPGTPGKTYPLSATIKTHRVSRHRRLHPPLSPPRNPSPLLDARAQLPRRDPQAQPPKVLPHGRIHYQTSSRPRANSRLPLPRTERRRPHALGRNLRRHVLPALPLQRRLRHSWGPPCPRCPESDQNMLSAGRGSLDTWTEHDGGVLEYPGPVAAV